uniref:Tripartite motif-containing protein 75 n=1 Tax=Sus scrofa TaxID=9823 RepID=A0A5G2R7S8_PIG
MGNSSAASLAQLQAEASCPICLDYLRDPVTTDCGHNFCHSCLLQRWEGLQGDFPCPVCLQHCPDRSLRRNTQLCHMVDVVKQLPNTEGEGKQQEEKPLCEKHHQVLSLFCEEDLELLCPQCQVSCDHQDHHLVPMEQAAACHRKRLKGSIEHLTKQFKEANKALEIKVLELREHVQRQRLELASDFAQLNRAVDREQEAALARLVQEEHTIHEQLGANIAAFSDHIWELRGLLQEVTERSVLPGAQLLRGIGPVLGRCESLKCPEVYSFQLRREGCSLPAQHSALQKIIQKFTEDVILDPESAHPDLLVSEDRKSATLARKRQGVPRAGRSGAEPAVLGLGGFGRGRRYWEVRVGGATWAVGLCTDSAPRPRAWLLEDPRGSWTVGRREGAYEARGPAGTVPLELKEDPGGIGVYLDYELGVISFYSFKDRSHIYSFSDTFSEVLKPYFSIGCSSQPLTIYWIKTYRYRSSHRGSVKEPDWHP